MLYIRRPCFPLSVCKRKWKLWASLKSRKRRMCQLCSLNTWIESTVWGHCKTKTDLRLQLEFQDLISKIKWSIIVVERIIPLSLDSYILHEYINWHIYLNTFSVLHLSISLLYPKRHQEAPWSWRSWTFSTFWFLQCHTLDEPFSLTLHLTPFVILLLLNTYPNP